MNFTAKISRSNIYKDIAAMLTVVKGRNSLHSIYRRLAQKSTESTYGAAVKMEELLMY